MGCAPHGSTSKPRRGMLFDQWTTAPLPVRSTTSIGPPGPMSPWSTPSKGGPSPASWPPRCSSPTGCGAVPSSIWGSVGDGPSHCSACSRPTIWPSTTRPSSSRCVGTAPRRGGAGRRRPRSQRPTGRVSWPGGVQQQRDRRRGPRGPSTGAGRCPPGAAARRHLLLLHAEQGQPTVRRPSGHRHGHHLVARFVATPTRRARTGRGRTLAGRRGMAASGAQLATTQQGDPGRGGTGVLLPSPPTNSGC